MRLCSFDIVLFLCVVASYKFDIVRGQIETLNIFDFGAVGDGIRDDSQAFSKAWNTLCTSGKSLIIPAGNTFVLKPFQFQGPCRSSNVIIQIDGTIVGPPTLGEWSQSCKSGCWLCFQNVKGLTIKGQGIINGKGSIWWSNKLQSINETNASCRAPSALHFHGCNQLQLNGFTSHDSPRDHIYIHSCNNVHISNVHLNAPETSPNTDGIDISLSNQVTVQDSYINTGDDCVAIKGGSSYVNITHVTCRSGHGFSVGGLGPNSSVVDAVTQVFVQNCVCYKTANCARIKTWMGGSGIAKEIFYKQMTLKQSKNPIIIDQHYCGGGAHCITKSGTIKVSDITFSNFTGTSASEQAITLDCDGAGCNNIFMDHISLTSVVPGKPILHSFCNKASGKSRVTTPPVPCLSSKPLTSQIISPAMIPISAQA